ncbi:MAG: hypothetical protein ACXVAM_14910 [Vulcanimicrobiaceae bacterium]
MSRFAPAIFLSTLITLVAAATAAASAKPPACPERGSIFGTIDRINGDDVHIVGDRNGDDHVIVRDAKIHRNGLALRPGVFVGAFGCQNGNVFIASEITLAPNADEYGLYSAQIPEETLSGKVVRVEPGRLYVEEPSRGTIGIWYVADATAHRVGEPVTGIGRDGPNGAFYPRSINGGAVRSQVSGSGRSVTLSGIVTRVEDGKLDVLEPGYHTAGLWITTYASRFHVGQHVTGTGTEDHRGDFYPTRIVVEP